MAARFNIKTIDIIVIGISTGGPNALMQIIPKLPADLNVPIVIVQHMPTFFTQRLAEILDGKSVLKVVEGHSGMNLEPNVVHIAPGGLQMKLFQKPGSEMPAIITTDDPPENHCKPSADYLFRSVARIYPKRALGVIMTGMGADGVKGLQQMKESGAIVIAQDKESSVVFGMPMMAIKAGLADVIAPLDLIPLKIERIVKRFRK